MLKSSKFGTRILSIGLYKENRIGLIIKITTFPSPPFHPVIRRAMDLEKDRTGKDWKSLRPQCLVQLIHGFSIGIRLCRQQMDWYLASTPHERAVSWEEEGAMDGVLFRLIQEGTVGNQKCVESV